METGQAVTPSADKFFGSTSISRSFAEEDAPTEETASEQEPQENEAEASAAQQGDETQGDNTQGEESSANKGKDDQSDKDFQSLFQDAEGKRAKQQSRADTEAFRNRKLSNEIAGLKAQLEQQPVVTEGDSDFGVENLDSEDYLQVKDFKKILKQMNKSTSKQVVANPQNVRGTNVDPGAFKEWVEKQPDLEQVNTYYNKNKVEVDAYLDALGTDEMGQYMALRTLVYGDALNNLQDKVETVDRKRKPPVPITGPGGRSVRDSGGKKEMAPVDKFFNQSWNR